MPLHAVVNLSNVPEATRPDARTNLGATATGTALFTALSPTTARDILDSSETGDALFTAPSPAAARTTLGFDAAVPKIPITFSNSSDFPTPSTSFVDVTGLSFPVLANKKYAVLVNLITNKTDANGLAIQFTGPSAPTKILMRLAESTTSLTAVVVEYLSAFSSPSSTFNTVNGDGILYSQIFNLSNGANAGTVQLQLRAVTGGTAKIYAGSWIQITEL